MRTKSFVLACAIFGLAIGTALAEDFWTKKEWTQWSKGDCNKIVENSPWGKTAKVVNGSDTGPAPTVSLDATKGEAGPAAVGTGEINYYVSLYSAPPVRLALVRQQQLDKKYDKKSEADKQAFDKEAQEQFHKFGDGEIAFRVAFTSANQNLTNALQKYWAAIPDGSAPDGAYLIAEDGRKIPPAGYFASKTSGEFLLSFPRSYENKPAIADGAKSLKVSFINPSAGTYPAKVVTVEFRLDDIAWQGKTVY